MQYSFTSVALGAFAALVTGVSAGFNPDTLSNIAIYWGQNSVNKVEGDGGQKRLSYYCRDSKIDVIPLSFLTSIVPPVLNFANQGTTNLEADIQECQNVYHKTILLSVGGATYSDGDFKDGPNTAIVAANNIWAMFGPPTGSSVLRPFGSAVINGFDFDNEVYMTNGVQFAQELRRLMTESGKKDGKKYLLTAAPQCVFPDANVGELLNEVEFDAAFIQYYNNDCGVKNFDDKTRFNFETWTKWAKNGSKNPSIKLLIGAPGNVGGAGSGYVSGDVLVKVIEYAKNFPSFGGIMLWDMSQTYSNLGLFNQVYNALAVLSKPVTSTKAPSPTTSKTPVAPSVKPTPPTVLTPTTLSTKTKTAAPSPAPQGSEKAVTVKTSTVKPSTVKPTTVKPTTVKRTTVKPTSVKRTSAKPTSVKPTSVKPTSVKPTSVKPVESVKTEIGTVNQWNQCAGKDWNGGHICKTPYVCKYFSDWYSQCE